jgi:uncharacterized protein HemY
VEFEINQVTEFVGLIECGKALQADAVYKMSHGMTAEARKDLDKSLGFFGIVTRTPRETVLGAAAAYHHRVAHLHYAGAMAMLGELALKEKDYESARGYLSTANIGLRLAGAEVELPALMLWLKAEAWNRRGIKSRMRLLRRIFGLVDPEGRQWFLRTAIVINSLTRKA